MPVKQQANHAAQHNERKDHECAVHEEGIGQDGDYRIRRRVEKSSSRC